MLSRPPAVLGPLFAVIGVLSSVIAAVAFGLAVYDRPPARHLQLLEVGRQHWVFGGDPSSWDGAKVYVVWYARPVSDWDRVPLIRTDPFPSIMGDGGGRHEHGTFGPFRVSLDDLFGRHSFAVFRTTWQIQTPVWVVGAISLVLPVAWRLGRGRRRRRAGRGFEVSPFAGPTGIENRG